MAAKKKAVRSTAELGTLDDFLREEGKLEEFAAVAIKEVLAGQIAEAMRNHNLSRKRLAARGDHRGPETAFGIGLTAPSS